LYIDYIYFKGKFPQTKITANDFDMLCLKACKEIDNACTGVIEITDNVKMCACELINYIYDSENATAAYGVNSESVGDYSVSYASKAQQISDDKRKKRDIITFWLGNALTYRGVSRHVL
jgi:hypothetical protein